MVRSFFNKRGLVMQVGIDFGTTNSAVAHYHNGQLTPITVDPTNEKPELLPSLLGKG